MVNGRFYSVESIPVQFPPCPLGSVLENHELDERYFLSAANIERWQYLKGSKHELRHRKTERPISFLRERWHFLTVWTYHHAPC